MGKIKLEHFPKVIVSVNKRFIAFKSKKLLAKTKECQGMKDFFVDFEGYLSKAFFLKFS